MIDAHSHVVANDETSYPFTPRNLSGEWYRESPHTAEEFLACMDASDVSKAVLVQPVGAYSYDNRYAADSAARHAQRFASACCVDVDGEDPPGTLAHWVADRGMHGVRIFALAQPARSWLDDPRTFPLWEQAAALSAHVIVTIFHHQLPELRTVLQRFPKTNVSLDHCGFPPLAGAPWHEARGLFALSEHENLHCKVTTNVLDTASREGGDPRSFVESLVRYFGPQRVMWGSDFCQTHDRTYPQLVALGRHAFSTLDPVARAWCLERTAASLWPTLAAKAPAPR